MESHLAALIFGMKKKTRVAEQSHLVACVCLIRAFFFLFFFEEKCKKGSSDNNNKMAGFVARPFGYLFERAGPLVTDGRDPKRREHAIVRNVRLLCLKEFG